MKFKYDSLVIKIFKLVLIFILFSNINIGNNKALDQVVTDTDTATAWQLLDNNGSLVLGSNSRVAIIDSGIDWTHPSFYNPINDMSWAVKFDQNNNPYLDLNSNGVYDPPETLNYEKVDIVHPNGTVFAQANIFDVGIDYLFLDKNNNNIRELDEPFFLLDDRNLDGKLTPKDYAILLGLPKIEKIYDIKNGQHFTRGVNLTDPLVNTQKDYDGHGTHVAGIIAGGNPGFTKFTGIAPNATLLIAKAIDDSTGLFPENYLIAAIDWAIKENADVISMSLGGYDDKFLDGSDNLD
ncbi:MAG: S8 family serine peptidase, partial [Candidatus Heimdallarchaeota archaeon]